MELKDALARVVSGGQLTREEARAVMTRVMEGEATPALLGALLAALHVRGESVDEIAGFAETLRAFAIRVALSRPAVDVVGTGGDGAGTFNISTVSAIVCAAAGVPVAKHGNRAASSACGSADLLEALGVKIDLGPEGVARCVDEVGIGFMFAPRYHPAMKHAAPIRRELGIRTVFNILGPLANPAGVRRQLLGVATRALGERMAKVLAALGAEHALVVHAAEGIDEISPVGPTYLWEVKGSDVAERVFHPEEAGLTPARPGDVRGGDAARNRAIAESVLAGEDGGARLAVLLNTGAALYVAGVAADVREGAERAAEAIDSGRARETLARFVTRSQALGAAESPP